MRQTLPMIRLVLAAVFMAAPLAATAQPRSPAPAPARTAPAFRPWQVDWGQYYCSMIRKPEHGRPFATAFVMTPGGTNVRITLVPEGGQAAPGDVDNLAVMPGGVPITVTSIDDRRRQRDITLIHYYHLPPAFRDALAGAAALQLRRGDTVRATVPLDGVRGALAALGQCSDTVAREWGLDVAALAALSRWPASTNFLGLEARDYPESAIRTATQGQVTVRLGISAAGRATDCVPVASSGSPDIDSTVCRVAMSRGRYTPGLDAAGQPVSIQSTFTATFRLPED